MKYVIVLGDGMADEPLEVLGNKTPLEYANTPIMDELASVSEIGLSKTIPDGMKPGSDVANLAVLGYNPQKYIDVNIVKMSMDYWCKQTYNMISSREQTTAKSENEVIVRCTKDTNITPGKGKGIMRWSRNLRQL